MKRFANTLAILITVLAIHGLAIQPVLGVELKWPLEREEPWSDIASPFGPRLKSSENSRYDFHRGIDIKGDPTEVVLAMADGEVYRTYLEGEEGNPYTNGGTVVILKHTSSSAILFHGEEVSTYYTVYMHLSAISAGLEEGNMVTSGEEIGWIGQTGTTSTNHLHFEVRLGTLCSVYNSCNSTGYDPHINPLKLLNYPQSNTAKLRLRRNNKQLQLRVQVPGDEPDFKRLQLTTKTKSGKRLKRKVINFDTRKGINTSSLETLDTALYRGVTIIPASFSDDKNYKTIHFNVKRILTRKAHSVHVVLTDTHGNVLKKRRKNISKITPLN